MYLPEIKNTEVKRENKNRLGLTKLSKEMVEIIKHAEASTEGVLVDSFNIKLMPEDISTMRGLNWLNDNILNFYFEVFICLARFY